MKNGLLILHLLNSPHNKYGHTAIKRSANIIARTASMTTSTMTRYNEDTSNNEINYDHQSTKNPAPCAGNTNEIENYPTEMIVEGTSRKSNYKTRLSIMKDDGSPGPTSKSMMFLMIPSTNNGKKVTNVSVTHRLGADTEEAVIEPTEYATPVIAIPVKPPDRGILHYYYYWQQPRISRGPTGVNIIHSRSTLNGGTKRIQPKKEMIISQECIVTFSHATHAPVLRPGASSFTVMQGDIKGSFGAEALIEILAVELLSVEIISNRTWDVWIGHAINYSQVRNKGNSEHALEEATSRQPEKERAKDGVVPRRNGRRWSSLRHRPWEVGSAPTLTDHYVLAARPNSRHGHVVKVTVGPSPREVYPQQINVHPDLTVGPSPRDVYPHQINVHPDLTVCPSPRRARFRGLPLIGRGHTLSYTVCPSPRRLKFLVFSLLSYQTVKLRAATFKQDFACQAHRYNTSCDRRYWKSLRKSRVSLRLPRALSRDVPSDSFLSLTLRTKSRYSTYLTPTPAYSTYVTSCGPYPCFEVYPLHFVRFVRFEVIPCGQKVFSYPSPDVDPPTFDIRGEVSNKLEAGLDVAPQHDAERAWLHMANPYGLILWKVEDVVMNGDRPEEVAIQPVAHPRPSPFPHLSSRTSQNKASSCVRSIPPGRGGSAASMSPRCGLTPRQPEKERARDGDSAESMALNSGQSKELRAGSFDETEKLHPRAIGTPRSVLKAEGTNSCPRPASRNEVGAKRHE